jgi:hypothetical protein
MLWWTLRKVHPPLQFHGVFVQRQYAYGLRPEKFAILISSFNLRCRIDLSEFAFYNPEYEHGLRFRSCLAINWPLPAGAVSSMILPAN